MKRISQLVAVAFAGAGCLVLVGCGGDSAETTTAQAPPAQSAPRQSAPPSSPTEDDDADEGYGSEDYGDEGGGGGGYPGGGSPYGGGGSPYGSNGGGVSPYGGGGSPYGNNGGGVSPYGGGMANGGGGYGSEDSYGSNGSGYGSEDGYDMYAGSGYGDQDPYGSGGMYGGSGGGMYGQGTGGNTDFAFVGQFVRQNCNSCHGAREQKGGVRLDTLTADFENPANAALMEKVAEVLEAGSMPPTGNVDPGQKSRVIEFVANSLEQSGVLDRSYLEQAESAFARGDEKKAVDLLYAHGVTASEAEAGEFISKTRWFAKGRKPTTTLRFAAGVILDAPSTLTDLKPIGSSQLQGGGGGGMSGGPMMGPGGYGGSSNNRGSDANRTFNSLTGEFGSALVGEIQSRWANGQFGSVFQTVEYKAPEPANRGGGGGYPGSGSPYGGGGMGPSGLSGPGDEEGYGGYGGSGYGSSGGYGGSGYGSESDSGSAASSFEMRDNIQPGQTITPGMVYIGTGTQQELMERASNQGVDVVFIFDVDAKRNTRNNMVNNETRMRCMLVDGTAVGATGRLMNTEVERARMRGTEDALEKNMERFFVLFDKEVQLGSLPAFKAEHAKTRIHQLLTQRESLPEDQESQMDLQVMFEAKLFHTLGLVSPEELEMVYQIILEGNEGSAVVNGTIDDKKMVLDDMLASN